MGQAQLPPPPSSHHSLIAMMGSATKVSGQIRLRFPYRLFEQHYQINLCNGEVSDFL
jgi:hypothetical protein